MITWKCLSRCFFYPCSGWHYQKLFTWFSLDTRGFIKYFPSVHTFFSRPNLVSNLTDMCCFCYRKGFSISRYHYPLLVDGLTITNVGSQISYQNLKVIHITKEVLWWHSKAAETLDAVSTCFFYCVWEFCTLSIGPVRAHMYTVITHWGNELLFIDSFVWYWDSNNVICARRVIYS